MFQPTKRKFFIQDTTPQENQNIMYWFCMIGKDRKQTGVTSDVNKAEKFTQSQMNAYFKDKKYVAWPVSYVRKYICNYVDGRNLNKKESVKPGQLAMTENGQ